jgi:polar amino acid transport system substrate-binding protein
MMNRRRCLSAAALALCIVTVAGCSSPTSTPAARTVAAPVVAPAGSGRYTGPPATLDPTATCATGTASLAPPGTLPPPGQFPAGSTMAAIVARGHLIAGVDQNTFKWGYLDPSTNQLQGFDIDMILQVAQALFGGTLDQARQHVTFRIVPNADRVTAVQHGDVDIVAETMTINPLRQKDVDFSSVYYCAGQSLLVPVSSKIASKDDLGGKRVCAVAGSTSIMNLAGLDLPKKVIPIQVQNQTDCLVMLQQGQVDAISTDDTILQSLADQDPTLKLVPPAFTAEPYGMAIAKSKPDFTRFVNAVLQRERTDGTWEQLCQSELQSACPTAPPAATYSG